MSADATLPNLIPMSAKDALTHFSGQLPELKNARVTGELDLRSIEVPGPVRVHNCVFEGAVDATDSRFDRSVQFTNCEFEKGLTLAHARINGPLDLSGSVLKPANGAVHMLFRDLHVEGCIEGTRLRVECGLNFSDLECGAALRLRGAEIRGDLMLDSALIEGELDFGDCEKVGNDPASRTSIAGVLSCSRSQIESRVLLIGTSLGSATFEQTQIGGTMLIASGRFTACQTEIGVLHPYGYSLSLLGAWLHGNLEIRGAKLHGYLGLSNVEIRCNLVLKDDANTPSGGSFQTFLGSGGKKPSLRLASASVRGAISLGNVSFDGLLEAPNANVAVLELDLSSIESLEALSKKRLLAGKPAAVVFLEGLTFSELQLSDSTSTTMVPRQQAHSSRISRLLALTDFDEGTYARIEAWLRRSAKDDDADKVFREMRKKETAQRGGWLKRVLFKLLEWLYGYGTQIKRACVIWVITFGFSYLMFSDGSGLDPTENGDQSPAIGAALKSPDWVDKAAVVFRIHLPIVPWLGDPEWKPAARRIPKPDKLPQCVPWPPLRYDVIAHSFLVWNVVNVTLIIASISGLLKRRGS